MSTKIVDKDRGFNNVVRGMSTLGKPVVEVGILAASAGAGYSKGTTVLDVAAWNEFGTSRIPSRSFLRAWYDENVQKVREWLCTGMQRVLKEWIASGGKGKGAGDAFLNKIGLKIVGEVQARIASSIPPPNAPSTVKRKGSSTTLIDTGQLRSSITHRVKR